uniref:Kinesin-like protein n=1 Tax=Anolis carolinensis TaxID=28377 RepID=A0A803SQ36_ANOCA
MAHGLESPANLFSDDEAVASPVLESTVADCGAGLCRSLLPDFSAASDTSGKVKVYARVRPLKASEVEKQEDQGCVCIENHETLLLKAPKDSFANKNSERGIGHAIHKCTFTQIFGPEVSQKSFFDAAMKDVVTDVLNGKNWLVYTYGVTNSGKTYTIQGNGADGGILPRSLAVIFNSIGTRMYQATDLKPILSSEVIWLDSKQVRQEEMKKQALMCGRMKEVTSQEATTSIDSGFGGLSSASQSASQTSTSQLEETHLPCYDSDQVSLLVQEDVQFSIWVSFFEIYNELIYDLLEMSAHGLNPKRPTLRLCEDQTGNPYVKDLNWINIKDADEAWRLLKLGRKNQSFASTHMNQNSSRSHSIFSIRILHLQESNNEMVPTISELSLCDLAGSERCKEQRTGDRMKEANNINTSLHTLGRCLRTLRQNQQSKLKQSVVPFRDSKLTRVFQGFFTGHGQSCMIVNINPCASSYDETLHVAKFSAIASQLIQAPSKVGLLTIQALVKEHGIQSPKDPMGVLDEETASDEGSEDETDVTAYGKEALEAVQELLMKERRDKLLMEIQVREEVCNVMMEKLQEKERWWRYHFQFLISFNSSLVFPLQDRDERIKELEAALQEAKQQQQSQDLKPQEVEESLRRSKRVTCNQQQNLQHVLLCFPSELRKYRKMTEPPPSAKPITANVDRKLEEGQKNVRLLRSELLKLEQSLQSAERACCHSTGAGKLRETLANCDRILIKQDQTLAELHNNMMLVKIDLRKKATCIAEQYQTVQKLQAAVATPAPLPPSAKKRFCANNENMQPRSQTPAKKPFLRSFLTRSIACPSVTSESPYNRILRARKSPPFKTMTFGKKY